MSGCDWQKESFSVALLNHEEQLCRCGRPISHYKYNGERICKDCWDGIKPKITSTESFNVTKDKLYDFIDEKNFGKPIHITSKGQWKRELKKRGLTDDFTQDHNKYIKEVEGRHKENPKVDRKWIAEQIHQELQSKGLRDKVYKRR